MKNLSEMTLEELWQLFPIELSEYNPAWSEWYDEQKFALLTLLGDAVQNIVHIGSTAIAGLLAKPIVDMLLQVTPDCDVNWLKSALQENGWLVMDEQPEPKFQLDLNKGYTPDGFAEKVFHLHIRGVGDWDEPYFRDYIVSHPEAAVEYETLKRSLLAQFKHNRDAYTKAKGDFIRDCTAKARIATGHFHPSIKPIAAPNAAEAINLVWRVFCEFEAPEYSEDGVVEFRRFLDGIPSNRELHMKGCWVGETLAGVMAMRPPCHISLLFVDKSYHRQGIARSLWKAILADDAIISGYSEATVNSSPYAVAVYKCLGFTPTDEEQIVNGIRFVPMKYNCKI